MGTAPAERRRGEISPSYWSAGRGRRPHSRTTHFERPGLEDCTPLRRWIHGRPIQIWRPGLKFYCFNSGASVSDPREERAYRFIVRASLICALDVRSNGLDRKIPLRPRLIAIRPSSSIGINPRPSHGQQPFQPSPDICSITPSLP